MEDIQSNSSEIQFLGVVTETEEDADLLSSRHPDRYTLPFIRFKNVVVIILIIDAFSTLGLWVGGRYGDEFFESIIYFTIRQSVFELAMISLVKLVILWSLYTYLEDITMLYVQLPYEKPVKSKKNSYHISILIITLICLVYSLIKGGLILDDYLHNPVRKPMYTTYLAACISTVAFGFLELLLALLSVRAMRLLTLKRIVHTFNDEGEEIDDDGNVIHKPTNLKRVIKLAKPEVPLLSLATFVLFISSATQTAAPFFFGLVVDAALESMSKLNKTVLILLLIYIVGAIAGFLRSWLFTLAGQRLVARLRKDVFSAIIRQDVAFFDITRTGELTNRLSSDTTVIQNAVTVNISMLARYMLEIIGSLVVLFILNPSLTGVLLAVVPVVSIAAVQYGRFLQKLQKEFQDCLADASTTAEENISNIRTVRSFFGEIKANNMYGKNVDKSYDVGKRLAFIQGAFSGVVGILASGAIVLVLWYGGKLVHQREVTPGILTAFLLYTLQVAMAFAFLSSLYGDFMKAVGASVRIFDLMDRKPTVGGEANLDKPDAFDNSIAFDSVQFTYPSRPDTQVLKGVTFGIDQGEMIALVGPSGGGKSTIVSLIERFYDPDTGAVILGGHNVRELDQEYFRSKVSIVSQEPVLFACSIKDNITYGKDASMEEIIEVAKLANAHDFIMSFEDQYDTLVGEKGVRLSGGQKQRVAIARALMTDPAVLLLDEATSALDAESEHLVQQAIDNAMQNRTVLVVAHRLSTVRNAHKVVVIDKGKIAEQGTHDELIAQEGVYKKLVLRQLEAAHNNEQNSSLFPADKHEIQ